MKSLLKVDEKTFWVDEKNGDDSNAGTAESPFKTFHHAYIAGKRHIIIFFPSSEEE